MLKRPLPRWENTFLSNQPQIFEAMACGAFVLTDRQKDCLRLFKDGEHLVYFDGPQDLRDKARYYLDNEDKRRRIARGIPGCHHQTPVSRQGSRNFENYEAIGVDGHANMFVL